MLYFIFVTSLCECTKWFKVCTRYECEYVLIYYKEYKPTTEVLLQGKTACVIITIGEKKRKTNECIYWGEEKVSNQLCLLGATLDVWCSVAGLVQKSSWQWSVEAGQFFFCWKSVESSFWLMCARPKTIFCWKLMTLMTDLWMGRAVGFSEISQSLGCW